MQEMSFQVFRQGVQHQVRIAKDGAGSVIMTIDPGLGKDDINVFYSREEELEIKSTDLVKIDASDKS